MSSRSQLEQRLQFLKLGEAEGAALKRLQPFLARELPRSLDKFYDQVRAFPETAGQFSSEDGIQSARSRQIGHWQILSNGEFGEDYEQGIRRVGHTHARIGLEPRWYIGGYALVLEQLARGIIQEAWPRGLGVRGDGAEAADAVGALLKAALLDMDLAISVYLEAAEEARVTAEREVLERERAAVGASVGAGMARLAEGDLTYRLADDIPAEYAALRDDFNRSMDELEAMMERLASNTHGIRSGVDEIATAADDLSRRTEQQAASLEETAAALDEMTATVRQAAGGARQASEAVAVAREQARSSGEVVNEAVTAMGEIEASSGHISQIIGVIDEIAFQTNLLALNAGVEAARAGDAGRGFAVVASEIRALAQRSADAAREIKGLISTSSTKVEQGVRLVGETGEALTAIITKVSEIDTLVMNIAASAQEQVAGLEQVNSAVIQMDQVTQQNAAMVEQSTAATHGLRAETGELGRMIGRFRVRERDAAEGDRLEAAE